MASVGGPVCGHRVRGRGRGVLALTSFEPLPRPGNKSAVAQMKNNQPSNQNGVAEKEKEKPACTPSIDIRTNVTVQRINQPLEDQNGLQLIVTSFYLY